MRKVYRFKLTKEELKALSLITRKGKARAAKVIKSRALLLADESPDGKGWTDAQIMEAVDMAPSTLARLRQRCCEVGPLQALERKPQSSPSRRRSLDGDGEAKLVAIACSDAPEGYSKWTLQLIADRLVEMKVVEGISRETVRKALKKTGSSHG